MSIFNWFRRAKKIPKNNVLSVLDSVEKAEKAAIDAANKAWNEGWEDKFVKPHGELPEEDKQNLYVSRDMELSNWLLQKGKTAEAERLTRQAASNAEKLQHPQTRCIAFRRLGDFLYQLRDDLPHAELWLRRAAAEAGRMTDSQKQGTPYLCREVFKSLAEVLQLRGKDREAVQWLQKAKSE